MNSWLHLAHQACFGGIAALGFAILFHCPRSWLPLGFTSGFIALAIRTTVLDQGSSLPVASFAAALAVSLGVELLRGWPDLARSVLAIVGCIPMIPGSLASKAVLGIFTLSQADSWADDVLTATAQHTSRFTLTIVAMGTALVLPALFRRTFPSFENGAPK